MTRPRAGALLLELVIALGITVGVGMTLLSLMGQSQRSLVRSIELTRAADLAASAAAQIEASIATVDELDGPAATFDPAPAGGALMDLPDDDASWRLEIETDRAGVAGLTMLEVTAVRTDDESVRFTLRRLVRLASDAELDELPESDLQELIEQEMGSRFGGRERFGGAPSNAGGAR